MLKRTRQQMVIAVGSIPNEGPVTNQVQTNSRNKGKGQEAITVKPKKKYTRKGLVDPLLSRTQERMIGEDDLEPLNVKSSCTRHTSQSPEREVIVATNTV